MTYAQANTLALNAAFVVQVRMATLGYARVVMGEAPDAKARLTEKRQSLAAAVIADGCEALINRFVFGIAAQPGFSASPADADVDSAVQVGWNDFALVTGSELAG